MHFTELLERVFKPEYLFQPRQALRRLVRGKRLPSGSWRTVRAPGQLELDADVGETIGHSLWCLGVYDLGASETLWRLLEPGEVAVDVGANIGYVSALMARRVGRAGRVIAYEPHPSIHATLARNAARWASSRQASRLANVELHRLAASDVNGEAELAIPVDFERNQGTASLVSGAAPDVARQGTAVSVPVARLDDRPELRGAGSIVMKVDTEGHELAVFRGAAALLDSRRVRDIVFEDHGVYPTPAMRYLEQKGYFIYRIEKRLFGPRVVSPQPRKPPDANSKPAIPAWEPANYLATIQPARARAALGSPGWRSL